MSDRDERDVVVVEGRDRSNVTAMVIGLVAVLALVLILILALGGENEGEGGEITVPTTLEAPTEGEGG